MAVVLSSSAHEAIGSIGTIASEKLHPQVELGCDTEFTFLVERGFALGVPHVPLAE